jgi:UDP-glucuronate 4-epimerase
MPKYLVTGAAGFIGYHTSRRLLARGDTVVGLDSLNDYYSVELKRDRISQLAPKSRFNFRQLDLVERSAVAELFAAEQFDAVIHLAAQAGVRYSIRNPNAYVDSNLVGFVNVLEGCRHAGVKHLVYASSSSVYGANKKLPFAVHDPVDHPISLYAATKKANELMAHTYSHLYALPTTGLRFFTVYGPWGRPDMAMWLFVEAILGGRSIDVFNHGKMRRDFTYVDDVVEGVVRVADHIPVPDANWSAENPEPGTSFAPFRVHNIGNNRPVELLDLIAIIEKCLGRTAQKRFLPLQPGDVPESCADIQDLSDAVGYQPKTPIEEGVAKFVDWYREYHGSEGC